MSDHPCPECEGCGSWPVMNYLTGQSSDRSCSACEGSGTVEKVCDADDCDACNPVIDADVICDDCGEHTTLRQETGTECCNDQARFR
jgi:hypothetical protein